MFSYFSKMKIAFITSCLEPGRDGVGDYTRLLAEECVRQGHECCLLSLNDRFLTHSCQSYLLINRLKIPLLRLPASTSWGNRTSCAKDFLNLFQPDWLSIQFVPYGFQSKGIVYGLSKRLSQLAKGRKVHIMFHEVWLGQHLGAKLKERMVGKVQKFFVLYLVKQLQPLVVHTSNSAYVAILKQHGILASRLPLFGNIPIAAQNGDIWLFPELHKLGLEIKTENRDQFWLFGFFGTLHPIWPAEPLFTYISQTATRHNRKVGILSIGRLSYGKELWKSLSKTYGSDFVFLQLGELPPAKISEFLNSIDFSIASSPYLLVGKSGSVAAMLEHGLPIIVNRDDFKLVSSSILEPESEPLLHKVDCHLVDKLNSKLSRTTPKSRLSSTAIQFTTDLTDLQETVCSTSL